MSLKTPKNLKSAAIKQSNLERNSNRVNQTNKEISQSKGDIDNQATREQGHQRIVYCCHYCGKDLFSSNYQLKTQSTLGEVEGDFFSFSESLCNMSLLKAQLNERIYKEVYCPLCNTKLGFLFVDTDQVSKKRFFIPSSSLVFQNSHPNPFSKLVDEIQSTKPNLES